MSGIFDEQDQLQALERLYIYDPVNHNGFPLTPDILAIDIDSLSHEERILLSLGAPGPVKELILEKGDTLINQFSLATRVFGILINKLLQEESAEKRHEVLEIIRKVLKEISEGNFDED